MNGLAKFSVKRPVTTFMILLIAIALGFVSVINLQLDLFPNMNIPYAIVLTTYNGVGSEEMESLVTEPLEKQLSALSGLDTMTSQSSEGMSVVILKFNTDVDIDLAAIDIREKSRSRKIFSPR